MEERTQGTETKIRRDIPLEELSNFCSGVAEVADDIIGESGGIPGGAPPLPRRRAGRTTISLEANCLRV